MAKIKQAGKWVERSRKGSQYWLGVSSDVKGWCIFSRSEGFYLSDVKGWCIFSRSEGFYLKETSGTSDGLGNTVPSSNRHRTAYKFGPFGSFDAARAAATIMISALKGDSK